jgi:hypothetical protein
MSTNGQLVFTDVDKITFKGVGNASNAVVDTLTGKIGVGVDSPDANLHVLGNSYVSTNLELGGTLIMGTVNVEAQHSLEAVTATGNTTPVTLEFTNATTGIVTTGNVEVGGELTVSGNATVSSNLTVSGNVVAGYLYGDGSELTALNAANIGSGTLPVSRGGTGTTSSTGTGALVLQNAPAFTGDATFDTNTLKIDATNNRVGVGLTNPSTKLHIGSGDVGIDRDQKFDFGAGYSSNWYIKQKSADNKIYFERTGGGGNELVIDTSGKVGIGTASPLTDLHIKQSGLANHNGNGQSGIRFERGDNTNNWNIGVDSSTNFNFMYNNSSMGYLGRSDVSIISFTGQHRNIIRGITPEGINELQGLIVSANTNKYIKINNGVETGSNAITINESIPVVSLSNVVTDKTCFGVISASEDPEERSDAYGNFVTPFEKEKGDTRVFINSVGEGAIWVVNTNGSLESGDYITTSNVAGYGQKQDSEFLANYTVAKITMDCDFDPVTQPVQIIKKGEDEENVLDEHGQIQWEDHPTETEKAYKIRYLDASGVETDEANAVHTAAFVGCTYHCG